jgi:glycosyltransferase involved in cell wall biosynthesis
MIMTKKIDILLATFNSEAYIADQLHSILNQSYQNFQIIIRDDDSKDSTLKIIEQISLLHPDKIKIIKGLTNLGCKNNFSFLMSQSQADYQLFSDADDVWLPIKIAASLELMVKNEEKYGSDTPLLVHTDLEVVDQDLHLISPSFIKYSQINTFYGDQLNRLLIQNIVTGCTVLMNRSLSILAQPVPDSAIMHDWWIALVACAFGKILFLNQPTLKYRQHGRNTIGAKEASTWKNPLSYIYEFNKILNSDQRRKIRESLKRTFYQAEVFHNKFSSKLSLKHRLTLENYLLLSKSSAIKKRILLLKNQFFKSTNLKNLGTFLFI